MSAEALPMIIPVSDLRQDMSEVMESIEKENRRVVLTKHGRGKFVLLSIEDYNRITAIDELYKAIDVGLSDIEAGRVSDFREFATQLRGDMKNGRI